MLICIRGVSNWRRSILTLIVYKPRRILRDLVMYITVLIGDIDLMKRWRNRWIQATSFTLTTIVTSAFLPRTWWCAKLCSNSGDKHQRTLLTSNLTMWPSLWGHLNTSCSWCLNTLASSRLFLITSSSTSHLSKWWKQDSSLGSLKVLWPIPYSSSNNKSS